MKNLIWLLILLLTISFHSEAVSVLNKRNTAPDGVVLNSVNVLPGTSMLLSQEGKNVSITCKQSSSTATGVHFELQVNSGAGGTWTALHTASSAEWVGELEAGKQYKCVATNSAGTKESEIYQSDVISINIFENPCKLHEFQPSLACTCKATSKIGNPNIKVKWYADGFTEGSTEIVNMYEQGKDTALEDGIINRNKIDYRYKEHVKLIQCRLWKYNGIEIPEPLQKQILHQTKMDVTYFAAPVFKKSSENETHAAYNVTVNSNPLTQQVTCDPPAVVQKLSNSQWNITIPIVNSTTTDYRGQCLADGKSERVIDVAGYHNAGKTDEAVQEGMNGVSDEVNGGRVAGAVIGILILLILIILFILWRRDCLTCFRKDTADEPDNEDDSSDELCHCCCLLLRSEPIRCNRFHREDPESKDVNELLRWTSETWYEKDHENWVNTRDQLQPD
ncbi:uncharacterized protein LOC141907859 [Tubulanus polymorphus]|uniref:uncharacterized protein LOC141907859 n=1 Tax=Tubulanus polymorphus TaxID=672921 RepID=UPI003DA63393